MKFQRLALASLAAFALAGPARAKESGNFVVMLGQDTTGAEQYIRTPERLEVNQVGRAPRVLRRHFVYDYAKGALSKFSVVVGPPGSTTPTQTIDGIVGPDSMRVQIHNGTAVQDVAVAAPAGLIAVATSSPWAVYEGQIMKFVAGKADSLRTPMSFIGATTPNWLTIRRLGRDSVVVSNDYPELFHVRIDKAGHVLGVRPLVGTLKFSAERVPSLDVDAVAASYAAREKAGAGLGMLSPRDSVVTNVAGASLWIDYGRPAKRGRVVFGGVVPYGQVWRTGANAATQFRTDKALDFGGTVVPAGFYTLWTLPSPNGWKLIVNGETGQWGTAHKAEKDLYTIDMKTSTLPQVAERFVITVAPAPQGGVLNLDWDTTRASAPFTVKL